jgi:hypothetical protein
MKEKLITIPSAHNPDDSGYFTRREVSPKLRESANLTPDLSFADLANILDTGTDVIDDTIPSDDELDEFLGKGR